MGRWLATREGRSVDFGVFVAANMSYRSVDRLDDPVSLLRETVDFRIEIRDEAKTNNESYCLVCSASRRL